MIEELCPMEAPVLLARRTGQWTKALERHIAECSNCRELVKISGFMNGIADGLRREAVLPDPVLVWLRAQWIEREEMQRRYLARTAVRRALKQAAGALVLLFLVMGIWSGADPVSDGLIRFTLTGTVAFLFLGGFFVVSRWRGLLVH